MHVEKGIAMSLVNWMVSYNECRPAIPFRHCKNITKIGK